MASFTLGTASQATGTAKSTILRAIKAGRISASRDELNQWQIEPAELFRVFPALAIPGLQRPTEQGATQIERDAAAGVLVAELRATLSDMRRDRDRWHEAFEKEQAAHARTQDALAMTQRLLPPPSATPTEHGATAVEQDATPPNAQIERDATPIKKGEVPDQAVPFGRSGITEPDLPPLGIQCTQKKPRQISWLPWRRPA
jgi:hypothetical protein